MHCHWSWIKILLVWKKVPCVPPICDNNSNTSQIYVNFSICYFSEQWTLLKNISTLSNTCFKYTKNILDTIVFSKGDIYKKIKSLEPKKAHGHDMISMHMLKLSCISICKHLEINFQNCLHPVEERKCCFHI